jgi:HD-like signal output (HDOD) protein
MSQLVQIMRTLRAMPPLPEVASRVLSIVRDPEYSIDALVGVVRTDPGLTMRILRICNSSLYSLAQPITSVSDAVAYLGSRNLVKLVMVSCSTSYFRNLPANGYADPAGLWRQSMSTATACQAIAERCGHAQPATAFTAGILHNLGCIAMAQVLEPAVLDAAAQQLRDPAANALEVERRVLGMDHAAAAGIVTENWNLPPDLRRAARNHHDPARIGADDDLTALLHVADQLVMGLGIGEPCAGRPHEPCPEALQKLRLQRADLDDVAALVTTELRRVDELLNQEPPTGR